MNESEDVACGLFPSQKLLLIVCGLFSYQTTLIHFLLSREVVLRRGCESSDHYNLHDPPNVYASPRKYKHSITLPQKYSLVLYFRAGNRKRATL